MKFYTVNPEEAHRFLPPPQPPIKLRSALIGITLPILEAQLLWQGEHWNLRLHNPHGVCNVTGKSMPWSGRWWRLSQHMTTSEIVGTVFKAYMTALEHEAREKFFYKGVTVYDPHTDVEELVRMRASGKGLDGRAERGD